MGVDGLCSATLTYFFVPLCCTLHLHLLNIQIDMVISGSCLVSMATALLGAEHGNMTLQKGD